MTISVVGMYATDSYFLRPDNRRPFACLMVMKPDQSYPSTPFNQLSDVCCCCRISYKWRTCGLLQVPETVPRVRIPFPPPRSLKCREIRRDCSGNCRKNGRNFAIVACKADRRKCPTSCCRRALRPFSPEGIDAVRFRRFHDANAMRSQTDGIANATTETLVKPCLFGFTAAPKSGRVE